VCFLVIDDIEFVDFVHTSCRYAKSVVRAQPALAFSNGSRIYRRR
jgi:hypothetical protein